MIRIYGRIRPLSIQEQDQINHHNERFDERIVDDRIDDIIDDRVDDRIVGRDKVVVLPSAKSYGIRRQRQCVYQEISSNESRYHNSTIIAVNDGDITPAIGESTAVASDVYRGSVAMDSDCTTTNTCISSVGIVIRLEHYDNHCTSDDGSNHSVIDKRDISSDGCIGNGSTSGKDATLDISNDGNENGASSHNSGDNKKGCDVVIHGEDYGNNQMCSRYILDGFIPSRLGEVVSSGNDRSTGDVNGTNDLNNDIIEDNVRGSAEGGSIDSILPLELITLHPNQVSKTLLCCGQTNSGKTYTTMELIRDIVCRNNVESIACYELIEEHCYDLLSHHQECFIRENHDQQIIVSASITSISSSQQGLEIFQRCFEDRYTKGTASNEKSSRSHAICDFYLVGNQTIKLIDLAGSERWEDVIGTHSSERLAETKAINYSLSCLKQVLTYALHPHLRPSNGYIPFRNSKLTLLLRDSIMGSLRASLVEPIASDGLKVPKLEVYLLLHLSPVLSDWKHTNNTLQLSAHIREGILGMVETEQRKATGALSWSPAKVSQWVASLDGGRYAELAEVFFISGKMLSVEWIGHVERRVSAAGGSIGDAHAIYDAFRLKVKKDKLQHSKLRPPSSVSIGESEAARLISSSSTFAKSNLVVIGATSHEGDSSDFSFESHRERSKTSFSKSTRPRFTAADRAKFASKFDELIISRDCGDSVSKIDAAK